MAKRKLTKWQTTDSQSIIDDGWLKLRADTCVTPDGHTITPWYVMEYPDWVNCFVIDRTETVHLLKHYRHGIDDFVTEILGGFIDDGETPTAAVQRELAEELGYGGGEIYLTGTSYPNPSNQTNLNYSFLAVGGDCSMPTSPEIGADFTAVEISFPEFAATFSGPYPAETYQSYHLANIFLALNFIHSTPYPSPAVAKLQKMLAQAA